LRSMVLNMFSLRERILAKGRGNGREGSALRRSARIGLRRTSMHSGGRECAVTSVASFARAAVGEETVLRVEACVAGKEERTRSRRHFVGERIEDRSRDTVGVREVTAFVETSGEVVVETERRILIAQWLSQVKQLLVIG